MSRAFILVLLLTVTGCATCQRHKVACVAVASVVVLSIPLMANGGGKPTTYSGSPPDYTTQPVNCHTVGCQ